MLTPDEYESIVSAIQTLKVKDVLDTSVVNIEYLFEIAVKELNDLAFSFDIDNTLSDDDISILFEWYKINAHFSYAAPFDTLSIFFNNYIDEKSVSNQWRTKMQHFLKNIKIKQEKVKERMSHRGLFFEISFDSNGFTTYTPKPHIEEWPIRFAPTSELIFENAENIDLNGKNCVFTGACPPLSQDSAAFFIKLFGGTDDGRVTYSTDYLIVGHKHSDYRRYGTKMSAAIFYREKYGAPLLIKFEDLLKKYPIKTNLHLMKKQAQDALSNRLIEKKDKETLSNIFTKSIDEIFFLLNNIIFDDINTVNFHGQVICATDSFYSKINRSTIIKMITIADGIHSNSVNIKTNIMILGEDFLRASSSSTYVKKVSHAIELKKIGQNIMFISETAFLKKFFDDNKFIKGGLYNE